MDRKSRGTISSAKHGLYDLYCFNFCGQSLAPFKNELKRQIKTGLRRTVFVIDLNDIRSQLPAKSSTRRSKYNSDSVSETDLIQSIKDEIQACQQEYDNITKRLHEEEKFNFHDYFLKNMKEKSNSIVSLGSKRPSVRKSMQQANPNSEKTKRTSKVRTSNDIDNLIDCNISLIVKEHNRIGNPEPIITKKFILDDPTSGKLYIIILGDMNEQFYYSLLRHNLPLQGIIHFLPMESKYDRYVGNNRTQNFILETLDKIGHEIYSERQELLMKPVGIFSHNIPVISQCMAEWYAKDIYNQFSWSAYDVEVLHQQYQRYYVTPYQEADVEMPANVSPQDLYITATTLVIQGRHQKCDAPASASDSASILFYLDSLLSASSFMPEVLSEFDVHGLAYYGANHHGPLMLSSSSLIDGLYDSFKSVTKFMKTQRLFVEDANQALTNMWLYVDQYMFKDVYRSCLDYHSLRNFIMSSNVSRNVPLLPFTAEIMILPSIIKLYCTDDSCFQRLNQLKEAYDDYYLEDLGNGNHLYTFRRPLNTIIINEGLYILPSCLCFRDFTVFQMKEFLQDLVTPKMLKEEELRASQINGEFNSTAPDKIVIDDRIFIRPNSIKAALLEIEKDTEKLFKRLREEARQCVPQLNGKSNRPEKAIVPENVKPTETKNEPEYDSDSQSSNTAEPVTVGLRADHPLLRGYNLEDIRQEIRVKTTKYHFVSGYVHMYEDFWCFADLNKTLVMNLNRTNIYMQRPMESDQKFRIAPDIRLTTKDNINIRILNKPKECSRMIMQYPNGLSIHYRDIYAEEIWVQEKTPQNELKRIMAPEGCIIVFNKLDDSIRILRYNGEIYHLYQHEVPVPEEEEFETENQQDIENETTSTLKTKKSSRKGTKKGGNKRDSASLVYQEDTTETEKDIIIEELQQSIVNEMDFLNRIMQNYKISYLYLMLTTTDGRVIQLNSAGKIHLIDQLKFIEWHDYILDEIYVERSDGVKIMWSQDLMKCYHQDGTLLLTEINEEVFLLEDDIDNLISSDSTHESESGMDEKKLRPSRTSLQDMNMYLEGVEEHSIKSEDDSYIHIRFYNCLMEHRSYATVFIYWQPYSKVNGMEIYGVDGIRLFIEKYINVEETHANDYNIMTSDDQENEDAGPRYHIQANVRIGNDLRISVKDNTMNIEAKAEWFFKFVPETPSTISEEGKEEKELDIDKRKVEAEGQGGGDGYGICEGEGEGECEGIDEDTTVEISDDSREGDGEARNEAESVGAGELEPDDDDILTISGEEYNKEELEEEQMPSFSMEEPEKHIPPSEFITFNINFMNEIFLIYNYLVDRIAETQMGKTAVKELYFLEKRTDDHTSKGFEFMKELPATTTATYKYCGTNYIMAAEKFRNINNLMKPKRATFKEDMQKFTRCPCRKTDKAHETNKKFPLILSTSVYCKIPHYFRNSDKIQYFLDSFDSISFKNLRRKMKNLLDQELYPEIAENTRALWSKNNWNIKHLNHKRHLFKRQQRLGLYFAMLKHKKFPKYHIFIEDYKAKVKCIDFMEFAFSVCENKEVPREEVYIPKCDAPKKKKIKKKCPPRKTTPVVIKSSIAKEKELRTGLSVKFA